MAQATDEAIGTARPTVAELFLGFLSIALSGFGGVLPWAHRTIVERRRWLEPEEFTDLLSLAQFLPGANVVNLAVAIGARFRGAPGALAALAGLLGAPVAIAHVLGLLYDRFGDVPVVAGAVGGVPAAAAGLVVAIAAKLAVPLLRADPWRAAPFVLAGALALGVFRAPLHWALLAIAPTSIAVAFLTRR
jgi:chromate transporter